MLVQICDKRPPQYAGCTVVAVRYREEIPVIRGRVVGSSVCKNRLAIGSCAWGVWPFREEGVGNAPGGGKKF